eukprot:COSAG01_NODE_5116_length_4457_cov_5.704161_2_plen_158_part_00
MCVQARWASERTTDAHGRARARCRPARRPAARIVCRDSQSRGKGVHPGSARLLRARVQDELGVASQRGGGGVYADVEVDLGAPQWHVQPEGPGGDRTPGLGPRPGQHAAECHHRVLHRARRAAIGGGGGGGGAAVGGGGGTTRVARLSDQQRRPLRH